MGGFARGMGAGLLAGVASVLMLGYGMEYAGWLSVSLTRLPDLATAMEWLQRNLGLSLIPFALCLLFYLHALERLRRALAARQAPERVAQWEHLVDVWTGVFFGIGVIWTAVGMRGALLFALGEPAELPADGAYRLLQRLVEGGILVALSTTIFGGVGGYLLRVYKALAVGGALRAYYQQADSATGARIESLLQGIRDDLACRGARQ
ncbi:MAG: hypothetical protein KDH88_04905 [Chromatiales bacterium]|nr:hypothetical protein [Chromatiales bacterium]